MRPVMEMGFSVAATPVVMFGSGLRGDSGLMRVNSEMGTVVAGPPVASPPVLVFVTGADLLRARGETGVVVVVVEAAGAAARDVAAAAVLLLLWGLPFPTSPAAPIGRLC